MGSLELFLHDENVRLPLLVQLGLIHVQLRPSTRSLTATAVLAACSSLSYFAPGEH